MSSSESYAIGDPYSIEKSERHRQLLTNVCQVLIETESFLEAVPQIAVMLAQDLHAECVCVFFRRKVNKELHRVALAINENGLSTNRHENESFRWDRSYSRSSQTLLNEAYKSDHKTINLSHIELKGESVNQEIVQRFCGCLPSRRFEHLIIVRIYIGNKQLGAIRVINHLDPRAQFSLSSKPFSTSEDVAVVSSIGAMLALAYANHRKTEKLTSLGKFADELVKVETEDDAIRTCLENLASDETGFPLAMWREYSVDGSSRIIQHHSPEGIVLSPKELPLSDRQGLPTSKEPVITAIDEKNFYYHTWAIKHDLRAVYAHEIPCLGRRCALVVLAGDIKEFDRQSRTWIEINADLIESTFGRIGTMSDISRGKIIGKSKGIQHVIESIRKIARVDSSVLLLGETGTGKEIVAQAIHELSPRKNAKFEAINCAALPETLLYSELFGHVKGAFTGADRRHQGYFERADRGTIFLDEIGDMPPTIQGHLLRVLEVMEFMPMGSDEVKRVNVRVIAATCAPLEQLVASGKFRSDLFFRLDGHRLTLPPLRDRAEDIPDLAMHFLSGRTSSDGGKIRSISDEAMVALLQYNWPGNVRELKKSIETAADTTSGNIITLEDLPDKIRTRAQSVAIDELPNTYAPKAGHTIPLDEFKDQYICKVIGQSVSTDQAAERLGISISTVRRYQREFNAKTQSLTLEANVKIQSLEEAIASHVQSVRQVCRSQIEAARLLGTNEKRISQILKTLKPSPASFQIEH